LFDLLYQYNNDWTLLLFDGGTGNGSTERLNQIANNLIKFVPILLLHCVMFRKILIVPEMSIAVENLPLPRRDSISKKSYRDAAAPRRYK
jgi:hypothetical protein